MTAAVLLDRYQTLVFDLDGTLIDTAADIRDNLSLALVDNGLAPLAPGRYPPDMHSPLRGIVLAQLAATGQDSAVVDAIVQSYLQRYAEHPHAASALYPGVRDYLASRQRKGCRMAVCTNKRQADALAVLAHFDLQDFFSQVIGADSAAHAKPDPAPLILTLNLLDSRAAESLLIGDSHLDALCAQRAGVGFVWHRAGYGGEEVLLHPINASFDTYAELDTHLVHAQLT
ncbi:MAG: 2-phosphoglycolate phosphatase [Rhodoferax sp.]|jgi:2-phosphoglycolate phosphatase